MVDFYRLSQVLMSGYTPGLLRGGNYGGYGSTFESASVVRAHKEGSSATVIMFHANEPGAKSAFNAHEILAKYPES